MNDDDVARLAYQLWEERGRPFGSPDEDWFRAESFLRLRGRPGRLPLSVLQMSPRTF